MKRIFIVLVLAVGFTSCNNSDNGSSNNDQVAANKAKVQRFYEEVINAHNVNLIDSFCHENFTDHNPGEGHSGKGAADLKASFAEMFTGFPDARASADFMVASGDTVVAYLTMTGTNSGAMGPMPATNKQMNIKGIDIIVLKDGKATDRWGVFDNMTMMAQLGMMGGGGAPADSSAKPTASDAAH